MRNGLYMFRHSMKLTQQQIADKIGCTRAAYAAIENGKRDGRQWFWDTLQEAFGIENEAMWELMRKDGTQ